MKRQLNILLLVVLLVCGGSFVFHKVGEPSGGNPLTASQPDMSVVPTPDDLRLTVLNGTEKGGLAKRFRVRLGWAGWKTEWIGNVPDKAIYDHSFLVNHRLPSGKVARLAARLGGLPVILEYDPRAVGDAVLVLGLDYPGLALLLPLQSGL